MPGYDLLVQAMGGLMSITGPSAEQPTKVGVALVDVITGLHACVGILAALAERERSGRGPARLGQPAELHAVRPGQPGPVRRVGRPVPGPMGNAHPSIAPYETFDAADGTLALAVGNDRQFAALGDVLGLDLAAGRRASPRTPREWHHRDAVCADCSSQALRTRPAGDVGGGTDRSAASRRDR